MLAILLTVALLVQHKVQVAQTTPDKTVIAVYNVTPEFSDCSYGADYNYSIDALSTAELTNETLLRFCSDITLRRNISLSDLSNITVTGYKPTRVSCTNENDAGIVFNNVHGLELRDLTFENCGVVISIDSDQIRNIKASVAVQNSTNIRIADVTITKSPGTGLALFYNYGSILAENSAFEKNGYDRNSGGNGVYLETAQSSYNISGSEAEYHFENCKFLQNIAATGRDDIIQGFSRFDKGGGMCIYIRASENVRILISNSTFVGNRANAYGGGLYTTYNGRSSHNRAMVTNSYFISNTAKFGGATYSGYLHTRVPTFVTPHNCSHSFDNVTFIENSADFGGGSSVFSSRTSRSYRRDREVNFTSCSWIRNDGQYGAALAILPNAWNLYTRGYLPTSTLTNCTLAGNRVSRQTLLKRGLYNEYSKGSGAFYCFDHEITFAGTSTLESNMGTALFLDLCAVTFSTNSVTLFKNNTGFQGGAIHELSSVIYVTDGAEVQFVQNMAEDRGGAIYEETSSMLIYDYSRTCFIDYRGVEKVADRNISIEFKDNFAGRYGHSIYTSTLVPCYNRYRFSIPNITADFFSRFANFTYSPQGRVKELATAVNRTNITDESWSGHVLATPGNPTKLPLSDIDDFGQLVETTYLVSVNNDTNISVQQYYSKVSNKNLLLYGKRNDSTVVVLSDTSPRQNTLSFRVTMQACPPGFIHDEHSQSCICAFSTDEQYIGIENCNLTQLRAYSKDGYWVGYRANETENEDSLVSGYCPRGFCSSGSRRLLPGSTDRAELDRLMCSETRTGILCGRCKSNYSVHFHSLDLKCKPNDYCHLGWLFYILSEIVPVTIIFLLILYYNIPFTSGLINGFIFYCQVVEVIRFQTRDLIPLPSFTQALYKINALFYLTFSLEPFVHDDLSYCLWKSAKPIDILVFKYTTFIYALLLVLLVTFFIPYCTRFVRCGKSYKCLRLVNYVKFEGGVIHGLSTFLILCYAQCARSSFLLLTSVTIYNKGSTDPRTMVHYDGELKWLGVGHLPYAIPATFLSLGVLILPPVLLLVYPLHSKVLSFLRISETRCIQFLFSPLNKLKPFFDSFQGSFKDEYRFFSGLYLVYRFGIFLNVVANFLHESFFYLEIQLAIMLVLHAVCQPYKKRLHNMIDTLLFGNLAIINAITYYELNVSPSNSSPHFPGLSTFTWVLTALPLLVAGVSITIFYTHKWWKKHNLNKLEASDTVAIEDSFDASERIRYESYDDTF